MRLGRRLTQIRGQVKKPLMFGDGETVGHPGDEVADPPDTLGFGLLIAAPAVIGFLLTDLSPEDLPPGTVGSVNLIAFAIIVSMTFLTAPLGARMAHALDGQRLKRIFAVFLLLVASNMVRKAAGW